MDEDKLNRMKQTYVSVSRPRRLGEMMTSDMTCACYDRKADIREMPDGFRTSTKSWGRADTFRPFAE